jgi:hypothetical protein
VIPVARVTFGASEQVWLPMALCTKNGNLSPVIRAATEYIARKFQVIPLERGTKKPTEEKWTKLIFKVEDFKPNDNIGLRSVNGLVDVDCDAPEVVEVASYFLPPTPAVYGRKSKPRSHWLYMSQFDKPIVFLDLALSKTEPKKATLIELRVNHQSMAPPSVHESGEPVGWDGTFGTPASREPDDILRALRLSATTGLVIRYYNPEGNRHHWCLALAGFFRKELKLSQDEATQIVTCAANSGSVRDQKILDRLSNVRSTYKKPDGEALTGADTLAEVMAKGAEFVASLRKIWDTASGAFLTDKNDKILANSQENIRRALKKLGVTLSYDTFDERALVTEAKGSDPLEDKVRHRLWLTIDEKFHFRPSGEFFDIVLQNAAYRNEMHPVRDYLASLKWDGVPRLDTWLIRLGKAEDSDSNPEYAKYLRAVSALVLLAAVRRVREPGVKFDEMLVLESKQGLNKSSALRLLCPKEAWFSDDLPLNVDAKQIIERTQGKWIIEAAELSGMHPTRTEHLKAMLSRQVDGPVRMAYAHLPRSRPRQFVVVGTTNDHAYLLDGTGGRRFWPVQVQAFDLDGLRRERDQLWAEAASREAGGESIRLDESLYEAARIQQEKSRVEDPWEATLAPFWGPEAEHYQRVAPAEIWEALGLPNSHRNSALQIRVNKIMPKWGYKSAIVHHKPKKDDTESEGSSFAPKESNVKVKVRGWSRGERGKKLF